MAAFDAWGLSSIEKDSDARYAGSDFRMETDVGEGLFNVGTGEDVTIRQLAETVMSVVGFDGRIVFDASKPDGTPRKLLNVDRMRELGWQAKTSLRDGIAQAYADFQTVAEPAPSSNADTPPAALETPAS